MNSLNLITYPHPVLRQQAKPVARVDQEFTHIVSEMFRIMYAARGVGLAANQVGIPLRLFVANPSGKKDEGQEYVFINPVITKQKGSEEAEEGCLLLPGVNANVKRSRSLWINAYNHQGQEMDQEVTGFLARIIQHETDHLDGVLFVDRIPQESKRSVESGMEILVRDFESKQRLGSMRSNDQLMEESMAWEKRYS